MSSKFSRRQIIKQIGMAAGSTLPLGSWAETSGIHQIDIAKDPRHIDFDKPITAIMIGAGDRGNVYGDYAVQYPDKIDIVAVAEPTRIRIERFAEKHKIPPANRFTSWEDIFKKPRFADAVIIASPDNLHFGPCMAALRAGYHILLEKPISPSEQECREILQLAKQTGKVVGVCHVLRYAPYFVKLKQIMDSGVLGKVVSLQHFEPIEYVHMSHSYVRGNWHNSEKTTPIILAKSSHDLDIIRWLLQKPCKKVNAFASLDWFRKENAPPGSTARCMDGCAVEKQCPYSALKIYHRDRKRLYVFDLPAAEEKHGDAILEALRTTNYGRCVFKMENDQPDHYTTNLLFAENVTATFSMEAFTSYEGRRTRVMGSLGDVTGDMESMTYTNFLSGKEETWHQETDPHGGGDWRLMENWVQAVFQNDASLLTSTIDASIESHIMAFMAEKSRKQMKTMDIEM